MSALNTLDAGTLKQMGRAHLGRDQLSQALDAFAQALRADPTDAEAPLLLGDCYLAAGDAATAESLYAQALRLDPDSVEAAGRLSLARLERTRLKSGVPEAAPADSAALRRLERRLAGPAGTVGEAELEKAADILQAVVNSPSPAEAVADRLDDLDALVPALLELNIRQAQATGRPDIAAALAQLRETAPLPADGTASAETLDGPPQPVRLLWHSADPQSARFPVDALRALGYQLSLTSSLTVEQAEANDVIITHHPHLAPAQIEPLRRAAQAGARVLVWLEQEIAALTSRHADYTRLGLNTAARLEAYHAALQLADQVCVPSHAMAEWIEAAGFSARVVPPGWDRGETLWETPAPARSTLNLGWLGAPGEAEDLAEIRRPLLHLLREHPETRLVIIGDVEAHRLFDTLPESRRQFIPLLHADERPYVLAQVDILLAPLRDTPFNRARSDQRLMEAGVRKLPWVASALPAALAWNAGGLLAETRDDWYAALRRLVTEPGLRARLGTEGRQRAHSREMTQLAALWHNLIQAVHQAPRPDAPAWSLPLAAETVR